MRFVAGKRGTLSLVLTIILVLALFALFAGMSAGAAPAHKSTAGKLIAVGAENEYANIIGQIGGKYVSVSAVESNPNTDPHTFEASPSVAETISKARLVVQNGLGYDAFMNKIEAASPNKLRKIIEVQTLLGLPNTTLNPHLWYSPKTMPAVAQAVALALESMEPQHAVYFRANLAAFDRSLQPWLKALVHLKALYANAPVVVTEPVGDYMLQAAGLDISTPWTLQADIMNGVDPAPQDITIEENLLAQRQARVFLYNQQVTDSLTQTFLGIAQAHHVPVVGIYETMPTGYSYQKWMLAETQAVWAALVHGKSTVRL
jgi:zinc/manganese transport system substrate-binding protein